MDNDLRKLSILAKLLRGSNGKTTSEIILGLENEGIKVSTRTVQRDLNKLKDHGWIESDRESIPSWKVSGFLVPAKDITTSLMFVLAGEYLKPLLPPSLYKNIQPYVDDSKSYLALNQKTQSEWSNKIAIMPKGYIFNQSDIAEGVIETIYQSLYENKQIDIEYTPIGFSEPKSYTLSPHGMVVRDERIYLLAAANRDSQIKQFLLHRISNANMQTITASTIKGFSLAEYIKDEGLNIKRSDNTLNVSLWVSPCIKTILHETPLSDSQHIEPFEDNFLVTATVNDVEELRHWLLSVCHKVTVMEPKSLRDEIQGNLKEALSYYV